MQMSCDGVYYLGRFHERFICEETRECVYVIINRFKGVAAHMSEIYMHVKR